MFRIRKKNGNQEIENPYWMSFSDIMSGLLLIFMLATTMLILELTDKKDKVNDAINEIREAEQVKHNIILEVKNTLDSLNIFVKINKNESYIRIPIETLTFSSNSDEIPNSNLVRDNIRTIGYVLYNAITRGDRLKHLDTIFLEGHTDSRTSNKRKGNWGLSTFRAISLWEFWNDELQVDLPLCDMLNYYGQSLFSVSGYASTRRVNIQEITEIERRANRRIDVRLTVKKPSLDDLQNVDGLL